MCRTPAVEKLMFAVEQSQVLMSESVAQRMDYCLALKRCCDDHTMKETEWKEERKPEQPPIVYYTAVLTTIGPLDQKP